VVLFDQSAKRKYLAQTGLVTTQPGASLPNHLTVMTAQPGERTLKDGADSLSVVFESPEIGGVKLVKTYTFKRGQYTAAVTHELRNAGSTAVHAAARTCSWRATATSKATPTCLPVPTSFTGPALITEANKYQKLEFTDIAKAKDGKQPDHDKTADNGWVAMVQHYFASAWLVAEARCARVPHRAGGAQLLRHLDGAAAGRTGPGRHAEHEAVLFAGRAGRSCEALAPGLELVKDYGMAHHPEQAAVLAARQAARPDRQLGLGHRGPGGAAEDRLLLAERQRLPPAWPR